MSTELTSAKATFTQGLEKPRPWASQADSIPRGYLISDKGVEVVKDDESELICGPLWSEARTKATDASNHGLLVKWTDRDGIVHEKTIRRSRLHDQGMGLVQELADEGLYIQPGKETKLKGYLAFSNPPTVLQSVDRLGWHQDAEGNPIYVRPDLTIMANQKKNAKVLFQPLNYCPTANSMASKGTLEQWKEKIVSKIHNQPVLLFGMCAAFAAALLKFSATETGGFHIYGSSSRGKTTMLQVAASVWGKGSDPQQDPDGSFCQRWNATSNALEGLADGHNDCLLCLDELGTYEGDNFGSVIYTLLGGQGKSRMTAEASLKKRLAWRDLVLSTGEISIEDRIKQDGRAVRDGQRVRMIDIPVSSQVIQGDQIHGQDLANHLKAACAEYYGVAGPAFIKALLNDNTEQAIREEVMAQTEAAAVRLTENLNAHSLPPTATRALRRFALVEAAGILAADKLGLDFSYKEITGAVEHMARLWLGNGAAKTETEKALEYFQSFVSSNLDKFADGNPVGEAAKLKHRMLGYVLSDGDFGLTSEGFAEARGSYDENKMLAALCSGNLIDKPNEPGKWQKRVTVAGRNDRPRLYKISKKLLEIDI